MQGFRFGRGFGRLGSSPAADAFDPLSAFAAGEKGGLFDASIAASLFSDTGGTTPLTITNDAALWQDQSPNAAHLQQATAGFRPTWKDTAGVYSLEFDDADDHLVSVATMDLSATDEVTVIAALTKRSDAATGIAVSFGNANTNAGAFDILAPNAAAANLAFRSRGATATVAPMTTNTFTAPQTVVVAGTRDIGAPFARVYIDGALITASTTAQGANTNGNLSLSAGARSDGANPAAIDLHYLLVVARVMPDDELAQHSAYAATKQGRVL